MFTEIIIWKLEYGCVNIGQITRSLSKIDKLLISNLKTLLHNANAHTKLGENPLIFTLYHLETKYGLVKGRLLCQKLMKFAHKQSKTRSPQYQCIYQVWWKSIDIYSLSSVNKNTDGLRDEQAYDRQTDGHKDNQLDTIIPRHLPVAGYKRVPYLELWLDHYYYCSWATDLQIRIFSIKKCRYFCFISAGKHMLWVLIRSYYFQFSANQITWSRLLLWILILYGKQCRSRSVGFWRSQLI